MGYDQVQTAEMQRWVAEFEARHAAAMFSPRLLLTMFADRECEVCGNRVCWMDIQLLEVDGETLHVCPECHEAIIQPSPREIAEAQLLLSRLVWGGLLGVTTFGALLMFLFGGA